MERVGGVPPSLSQCTKEGLLSRISRLCLHEVFEASRFHIGTGQRIEPSPPFVNLSGVALRHQGMRSLNKRMRHESIRRKVEESIEKSRRKHRK